MSKLHAQKNFKMFTAMCVMMAAGLMGLKHFDGERSSSSSPSKDDKVFVMDGKTAQSRTHFPDLVIQGTHVDLGKTATVEFSTDAAGTGSFGMRVGTNSREAGSKYPFSMSWPLEPKKIFWNDDENVVLEGLRPNARYAIEVGFWVRNVETNKVWSDPGTVANCGVGCIAALGAPVIVGLESGPAWRRAEVAALADIPWPASLMLAMGLALWRMRGRGAGRKLAAAVGIDSSIAMPVKPPKAG